MADVWMVWFLVGNHLSRLTRTDVSQACVDLGVVEPIGRDVKVLGFNRACQVGHVYQGEDGVIHTLSASVTKVTGESVTAQVVREDGFKVAEYKYVQPRRTRAGELGPAQVKAQLRSRMSLELRREAKAWVHKAELVLAAAEQEVPEGFIRKAVRSTLDVSGWPVPLRSSAYFLYEDELDVARRLREFLATTTGRGEVMMVGLDDAERRVPAKAADDHLVEQARAINALLRVQVEHDARQVVEARERLQLVRAMQWRHERRLETALPATEEQLRAAETKINQLIRAARLPALAHA